MDPRAAIHDRPTRPLPPAYLLLAIVTMAGLDVLAPWRRLVPSPWSWAGVVLLAAGIVLNLVADSDLKKHGTTVKPFEESASLVTTGAYGICRHPMYLGFVLILVGLATVMGTLTPFIIVPLFVAAVERVFIRVEERMMEEKFGETWRAYKGKVGRWL